MEREKLNSADNNLTTLDAVPPRETYENKIKMTKHDLIIKLITLVDEKSRNVSIKLN
jgi:hypothetical protein